MVQSGLHIPACYESIYHMQAVNELVYGGESYCMGFGKVKKVLARYK